jgi:RNA recognition motif-containing protein
LFLCLEESLSMGKKLYVGNLPYSVRDGDLEQAFGQFGSVTSAKVMMERDTGRSKGFGFVEMGSDEEAQSAISGMNGQPLGGRSVVVNEARPMEERPPRSGGGGFGGGGGGGRREGGGESGFRSPYGSGPRGGGGGNGGGGRREGGGGY